MTLPTTSARVRAWVKPLKNGTWQYFAKVSGEPSIRGAEWNAERAHDVICDYVYNNEAYKHAGDDSWDIEWRT